MFHANCKSSQNWSHACPELYDYGQKLFVLETFSFIFRLVVSVAMIYQSSLYNWYVKMY